MVGLFFFFQAEDGIRDVAVTGVQTCALPISARPGAEGGRRGGPLPLCRRPRASSGTERGYRVFAELGGDEDSCDPGSRAPAESCSLDTYGRDDAGGTAAVYGRQP